ncbi:SOS response-associated peptidase [bacterium]|nr:SOS response-associated peptidase [bacterium]
MCYSLLVKQDLEYLIKNFGVMPIQSEFERFLKLNETNPKKFKKLDENPRIYPGYHAPIIISEKSERLALPMRYRVRPFDSEKEVPTKYNMFNARADSLTKRRTWQNLFMRNHGVLVFERFFEWVKDKESGKKKVVSFKPESHEAMWAPVLYDTWVPPSNNAENSALETQNAEKIVSFAVITTDPPKEILDNGHDRSPIFLRKDLIDPWLNPQGKTPKEMLSLLTNQEQTTYGCYDAVP